MSYILFGQNVLFCCCDCPFDKDFQFFICSKLFSSQWSTPILHSCGSLADLNMRLKELWSLIERIRCTLCQIFSFLFLNSKQLLALLFTSNPPPPTTIIHNCFFPLPPPVTSPPSLFYPTSSPMTALPTYMNAHTDPDSCVYTLWVCGNFLLTSAQTRGRPGTLLWIDNWLYRCFYRNTQKLLACLDWTPLLLICSWYTVVFPPCLLACKLKFI